MPAQRYIFQDITGLEFPQHMTHTKLDGRFWLSIDGHSFAGSGRITLLEQIRDTGSISAAARAMGMSYKAAWDAIDAMHQLAEQPLVLRQAGGRRGGGTALTPHGRHLIEHFRRAEAAHRRFLAELGRSTVFPGPGSGD